MRPTPLTGDIAMQTVALVALIGLAACGGGGGGGGGGDNGPTAPVDNTVARIDVSPVTPVSIVSGATTTLTATAFTKDNRPLGASGVTWASSNDGVATVASGVVTGRLVGTATITATSGSVTSAGVSITVSAGAAAQLGLRTSPGGAAAGVPFTAQPVVEVRDAAGNLVTSATTAVTAKIELGGGTLAGTATASAVGGVATFSGLSIAGTIGVRSLTFSAPGLAPVTSASFALTAGVATQLAIRTQPVVGTAYAPFTTPAVVEVRDASGNVASSSAPVVAAIASGGGTLGGSTTVNAVAGISTFASLTVNGVAGSRTLAFSSAGLTGVTSASFDVAAAPPAIISLSPSAATIRATVGQDAPAMNVTVTNTGVFPLTNLRVLGVTYTPLVPAGWLASSFPSGADAPATLRLTATSATFAIGTYTAVVVLAGDGAAANVSLTVRLDVVAASTNSYGTAANKVSIVNIGSTFAPGLVTTTTTGTTTDPTVAYVARSPAIATVDATGRITAVSPGQAWIAATSTLANADSVLVIVPKASGPVLRTDITRFGYQVGDTITFRVLVDARGASIGAVTATVTWPLWTGPTGVFGSLLLVDVTTAGSPMTPVSTVSSTVTEPANVIRLHGASVAGATGVVQLAVVRLRVARAGLATVHLNASELLAADFANLLGAATFTQYPLIVP